MYCNSIHSLHYIKKKNSYQDESSHNVVCESLVLVWVLTHTRTHARELVEEKSNACTQK